MPLEVQHELLRFSRLDSTKLLSDPSQQLAYGYVAGNALAWSDQMGLGLFKKRTAEEKAQRKRNRQYSKAMKKTQRAYKKQIGKNQTRKEKRKKFSNGLKNFAGRVGRNIVKVGDQVVRKTMASPNTFAGVIALAGAKVIETGFKLFGPELAAPDGFKSYFGYQNSAFEFGVLLPFGQQRAISLGNIHIYNSSTPDDLTRSYNGRDQNLGTHEGGHTTEQAESFPMGPFYLIRHILHGLGSDNNPLEQEAADFAADIYSK